MPHATGAMNAWALLVLTGPGKDEDAYELEYDWSPGLCKVAQHLAHYPAYRKNFSAKEAKERGHTWNAVRAVLVGAALPGVEASARLASWGVANLSVMHFASDVNRIPDDPAITFERALWVIGTCRPRFILVTPAVELDGTIEKVLRTAGAMPMPGAIGRWTWASDAKTYELRAQAWREAGGEVTVVCRANNHPSRWQPQPPVRLADALAWTVALNAVNPVDPIALRKLSGLDEPPAKQGLVRRKL